MLIFCCQTLVIQILAIKPQMTDKCNCILQPLKRSTQSIHSWSQHARQGSSGSTENKLSGTCMCTLTQTQLKLCSTTSSAITMAIPGQLHSSTPLTSSVTSCVESMRPLWVPTELKKLGFLLLGFCCYVRTCTYPPLAYCNPKHNVFSSHGNITCLFITSPFPPSLLALIINVFSDHESRDLAITHNS